MFPKGKSAPYKVKVCMRAQNSMLKPSNTKSEVRIVLRRPEKLKKVVQPRSTIKVNAGNNQSQLSQWSTCCGQMMMWQILLRWQYCAADVMSCLAVD